MWPAVSGHAHRMTNPDELKGRVKQAAGDLTDDDKLRKEGKVDETSGKVKDAVDDVSDKAKDALHRD
jgi:uncharacterized protein YjbJ (UPF0337 family)